MNISIRIRAWMAVSAALVVGCGETVIDPGPDAGTGAASTTSSGSHGMFPCGPTAQCDSATQYCQRTWYGGAGGGVTPWDEYGCAPLPAACAADASCGCLTQGYCADYCPMCPCPGGACAGDSKGLSICCCKDC